MKANAGKTSPTVIKFSDDVIQVKDVDTQLLRLALNELIEVNRDQLEGIYNLPTDASFYVPFTGYKLGFGQDGAGGGGGLPVVDLAGSDRFESSVNSFGGWVGDLYSWLEAFRQSQVNAQDTQQQGEAFY